MAKAKVEKKFDFSLLNEMLAQTAELESQNREAGGKQHSYLKLVGNAANDPIMKKGKPEYIEGAKEGSWVITSKKLLLGEEVTLTVLGVFSLYEDTVPGQKKDPKSKQEPMRKLVGYWMPEDAMQIPLEGMFERPFYDRDGVQHSLKPVHWAFVYLHDHPEIDDALITFRSTGNGVCKDLQKIIAGASMTCTELKFTLSSQEITSKSYERDYLYPLFELAGRNYDLVDGSITLTRGGLNEEALEKVIKRSHELQTEYAERKMVAKKTNLAQLVASSGSAPKALPASPASKDEYEPVQF